ncbi:MAG: GNAT family N-acetyltransferase [Ectothiorhodospiraceae bacterium]|nr:GNAT family N-acetyltransferase [Ectothiorhodospiraceae bacterium]
MNAYNPIANNPTVVIRRLWWFEREQWQAHLLRLSAEDRRLRFAGVTSDEAIRRYCEKSEPFSMTLIGAFVDGTLRAVGECFLTGDDWPRDAELAFSVEADHQGQGIGTELFRRLVIYARNRSVKKAYLVTEPHNERMRRVARKFGMDLSLEYGELEGRLELFWPTYSSVFDELLAEGTAYWQEASARLLHWPQD